MDFWEAQRRARKKTKIYLAAFILITLGMAVLIEVIMRDSSPTYAQSFPLIGGLFLGITFCVAGFQYMMYSSKGGSYVAESVGARRIDPQSTHPVERQLLNIVEEIAISASLPIPPIYIIPSKQINAFAAGLTHDNAAIAITEGALMKLNRDEVQGVIAHEFGHIYNGDMGISLRLAAMVMGFFFVLYFAMRILQFASLTGRSRSNQKGGNPMILIALVLMGAGIFTWFAGSVLKAMVSREREYLADACSVQFTRNPDGIANALKKIAMDQTHDMPKQGMAYSHMYLDNHIGFSALFATHPPLKKRIEAILGKTYMPDEWPPKPH